MGTSLCEGTSLVNDPADDQEPPARLPGRKTLWTGRTLQMVAIAINAARLVLEFFQDHGALTGFGEGAAVRGYQRYRT
jgi:hypothetical protein